MNRYHSDQELSSNSGQLGASLPARLSSLVEGMNRNSSPSLAKSSLSTHELNDAYNHVMKGTLSTETHTPFYHRHLQKKQSSTSHKGSSSPLSDNNRSHFTDPQVVITMSKDIIATTSKNDRIQVSKEDHRTFSNSPHLTLTFMHQRSLRAAEMHQRLQR